MREDLVEIKQIFSSVKGGWRTLIAVGSVAASMGAAIGKLFEWKSTP